MKQLQTAWDRKQKTKYHRGLQNKSIKQQLLNKGIETTKRGDPFRGYRLDHTTDRVGTGAFEED